MTEKNILSLLRETFPEGSVEKWQQAASQEIEGKNPFVELSWNNTDKISFAPYYDQKHASQLSYLHHFRNTGVENFFLGNRQWLNAPLVSVTDDERANKISLEHLSNGADAIFFALHREAELSMLLSDIEWPHCSLFFQSNENKLSTRSLTELIVRRGYDEKLISGAMFSTSLSKELIISDLNFSKFKTAGLLVAQSTPAHEISDALTSAVGLLESFDDSVAPEKILRAIAFSVPVNEDFLSSIAKLRALRVLWYQVVVAYGVSSAVANDLHVHVRCKPFVDNRYEPHGNMIESTTAAMASILGGCNSITVYPQNETNLTMDRIARNVSVILREESHLNKVANPVDGSYTLDVITDAIAQKAWEIFQSRFEK